MTTLDDAAERKIRELSNALWKGVPLEQFQVEEALRKCWIASTEAAAKKCDPWLNREEAKLRAGELSAGEWRSVKAVVTAIQSSIRGNK